MFHLQFRKFGLTVLKCFINNLKFIMLQPLRIEIFFYQQVLQCPQMVIGNL